MRSMLFAFAILIPELSWGFIAGTSDNSSVTISSGGNTASVSQAGELHVIISSGQAAIPVFISSTSGSNATAHGLITTNVVADVMKTAYIEQSTGARRSLVSSSASDTAGGTGARNVTIVYYDNTMGGPFNETVITSGTAAVNTVATNIRFIESMIVNNAGSFGSAIGTLSLKVSTGGAGANIGSIAAGDNQTFWAHHYIATGKMMSLTSMTLSAGASSGALFRYFFRNPLVTDNAPFVRESLRVANSDTLVKQFVPNVNLTGPGRFVVQVTPDANGVTWYATIGYFDQ